MSPVLRPFNSYKSIPVRSEPVSEPLLQEEVSTAPGMEGVVLQKEVESFTVAPEVIPEVIPEEISKDEKISAALQEILNRKIDKIEASFSTELGAPINHEITIQDASESNSLSANPVEVLPGIEIGGEAITPVTIIPESVVTTEAVTYIPSILESVHSSEQLSIDTSEVISQTPLHTEEVKSPGQEINIPVTIETIPVILEPVAPLPLYSVPIVPVHEVIAETQPSQVEIVKNPGQEISVPVIVETVPAIIEPHYDIQNVGSIVQTMVSEVITPVIPVPTQALDMTPHVSEPVVKKGFLDRLNSFIGEAPKNQ